MQQQLRELQQDMELARTMLRGMQNDNTGDSNRRLREKIEMVRLSLGNSLDTLQELIQHINEGN